MNELVDQMLKQEITHYSTRLKRGKYERIQWKKLDWEVSPYVCEKILKERLEMEKKATFEEIMMKNFLRIEPRQELLIENHHSLNRASEIVEF